jgi:hypothetical protein
LFSLANLLTLRAKGGMWYDDGIRVEYFAMPDDGHFRLTDPHGNIIARGSLSALLERVNQSVPRMNAEQAIAAAARAIQRERDDAARADALDQRERDIEERERQAFADRISRFADGVKAVARRMDALEQRQADATLAEEIKQADEALRALRDEGDLDGIKVAPNLRDAEKIEAYGGNSEAEGAIEKGDQLPSGGSPSVPERAPEPHRPPLGNPGGLPRSLAMSDEALYGRSFVRNADRKAWRRQMRSAN